MRPLCNTTNPSCMRIGTIQNTEDCVKAYNNLFLATIKAAFDESFDQFLQILLLVAVYFSKAPPGYEISSQNYVLKYIILYYTGCSIWIVTKVNK